MINNKKIVIVLPAYNAEKTLEQTYNEIPFDIVDDIILVDDKSPDNTIEIAKKFQPDVVGVSAGFDGYEKDSILGLNYSLNAYYECGYRLRQAFQNIFAVLEGGYHQDIKKCTESFMEGVNRVCP